jgi:hypothetical protein
VPLKSLAHLIGENDILANLDGCLSRLLPSLLDTLKDEPTTGSSQGDFQAPAGEPRGVKRKRPSPATGIEEIDERQLVLAMADALCYCIRQSGRSEHLKVALTCSPATAASILGQLTLVIVNTLSRQSTRNFAAALLQRSLEALELWTLRAADLDVTKTERSESNNEFSKSCLNPLLSLMGFCRTVGQTEPAAKFLEHQLERLIALHTVLPARLVFFTELSLKWSSRESISSDETGAVVTQLREVMHLNPVNEHQSTSPTSISLQGEWTVVMVSILFDIAARSMPRETIRRQQRELPWLEALWACLMLCIPHAMLEGMQSLLRVTKERDIALPDRTLLDLVRICLNNSPVAWPLIADIVQSDASFLVSRRGQLAETEELFELLRSIAKVHELHEKDLLIQDGIIIPIIHAFERARRLSAFVETWHVWLSTAISHQNSGTLWLADGLAIWQEESLCEVFGKAVRTSVLPFLLRDLLEKALLFLQNAGTSVDSSGGVLAWVVIVDSILPSTLEEGMAVASQLKDLLVWAVSMLDHGATLDLQRWRAMKLVRHLSSITPSYDWPIDLLSIRDSDPSKLSFGEKITLTEAGASRTDRMALLTEHYEKFKLLVSIYVQSTAEGKENSQLESTIIANLKRVMKDADTVSNAPVTWGGRAQNMHVSAQLFIGCLGVLSERPGFLSPMNQEKKDLIASFCQCIANFDSYFPQLRELFCEIVSSEELSSHRATLNQLFSCISASYKNQPESRALAAFLMSMPLEAISKSKLSDLATLIVESLKNENNLEFGIVQDQAALLEKVVSAANVSVGKPMEWRQLFELIRDVLSRPGLAKYTECNLSIRSSFKRILQLVWDRLLASANEKDKIGEILRGLFTESEKRLEIGKSDLYLGAAEALSLDTLVPSFWAAREHISQAVPTKKLELIRRKYFDALVHDVEALCRQYSPTESGNRLALLVQSLSKCGDLCSGNDRLAALVDATPPTGRGKAWERLKDLVHIDARVGSAQPVELLETVARLTTSTSNAPDTQIQTRHCKALLSRWPLEEMISYLTSTQKFTHSDPHNVNQWHVDSLFSAITFLTSPGASSFTNSIPANGPTATFKRLCTILSLLLSRNRTRVGGRFHLLLPALQGLLQCLFRPIPAAQVTSTKQPSIRAIHPPWLYISNTSTTNNSTATPKPQTHALPSHTSASLVARLLSSLCNPTPSSVTRQAAKPTLTDPTKAAGCVAGQYAPYLLTTYTRCQLIGQLAGGREAKAALMPGLYAVLDVVPAEVMRGMNSMMDGGQRAIWRGLWEEWRRWGRWDGG